eukprot:221965-Chlamydomonas_euryale.AAC.2
MVQVVDVSDEEQHQILISVLPPLPCPPAAGGAHGGHFGRGRGDSSPSPLPLTLLPAPSTSGGAR